MRPPGKVKLSPILNPSTTVRRNPALTMPRLGYAPTRRLTATPTIRNSFHAFSRDSIRKLAISIAGGWRIPPKSLPIWSDRGSPWTSGPIRDLQALARGPSGRIFRLKIVGERDYVIIGKELEIRRVLSRTHLYSSAFVVSKESGRFVFSGAGWGHGVGLCQIGAAVMANEGNAYTTILQHYYRGTAVSV